MTDQPAAGAVAGDPLGTAWCDYCDDHTPSATCGACSRPMCASCGRCDPCIYGDWYQADDE